MGVRKAHKSVVVKRDYLLLLHISSTLVCHTVNVNDSLIFKTKNVLLQPQQFHTSVNDLQTKMQCTVDMDYILELLHSDCL